MIAAVFIAAMAALPACDLIEECGTCEYVTEHSDGTDTEYGTPLPFCGDDLKEKEDASPVILYEGTPQETTNYWVCY